MSACAKSPPPRRGPRAKRGVARGTHPERSEGVLPERHEGGSDQSACAKSPPPRRGPSEARCGARHAPRAKRGGAAGATRRRIRSERLREEPAAAARPERSEVWREARTPSEARGCCRSDTKADQIRALARRARRRGAARAKRGVARGTHPERSEGVLPERHEGGSDQSACAKSPPPRRGPSEARCGARHAPRAKRGGAAGATRRRIRSERLREEP